MNTVLIYEKACDCVLPPNGPTTNRELDYRGFACTPPRCVMCRRFWRLASIDVEPEPGFVHSGTIRVYAA